MNDSSGSNVMEPDKTQAAAEREMLFSKFTKLKQELSQTQSTLKAANEEYLTKITRLQVQQHSLEQALVHIKALLKFEGFDVTKESDLREVPDAAALRRTSVRDAAYELLRETHPLHYRDLLGKLVEKGVTISGKNPEATLLAAISRDRRFRRTKRRGFYTLAPQRDEDRGR